jgi:CheY-like chemotaxis protein
MASMNIRHILIVDDDEDDRDFITYALSLVDSGIQCSYAADGKQAIVELLQADQLPDLVLLDINMPVMDGLQFLKFRQANPVLAAIPVIVHSTATDAQTAEQTLLLGANRFASKTNTVDGMVQLLKQIIGLSSATPLPKA